MTVFSSPKEAAFHFGRTVRSTERWPATGRLGFRQVRTRPVRRLTAMPCREGA